MSIPALLEALRASDAVLYVDQAGALRYAGPPLPADSPIRAAIAALKPLLVELFTYAPGGRCPGRACYRLAGHDGEHLLLGAGQGGTRGVAA